MKYPLREALRRNGKTHRPPGDVELDPSDDADEIERLVRAGVIVEVRGQEAHVVPATDGAKAEQEAQAEAEEEAKAKAEEEAKAKAEEEAKAKAEEEAKAEANADEATPEQDGASAAEDEGAEATPKQESKPAARKPAGKTAKARG